MNYDDRKILMASKDHVLVLWPSSAAPFVTAVVENNNYKPGDSFEGDWAHGHYFVELKDAIEDFEERSK